jgi:hypothetical protein
VKKVILTLCNRSCTKVFTLWPRISRKETQIPEPKFASSSGNTTKTGGSDPTFWASSRPKSLLGSLPPCGTSFGAASFPTAAEEVRRLNSLGGNHVDR